MKILDWIRNIAKWFIGLDWEELFLLAAVTSNPIFGGVMILRNVWWSFVSAIDLKPMQNKGHQENLLLVLLLALIVNAFITGWFLNKI